MSILENAITLHQQGNALEAESLYRQLLADNPDNTDLLHLLTISLLDQGQYLEAKILIQKAIQIHRSVVYLETLAEIQSLMGHFEEAIQTYIDALALDPNEPSLYYKLANTLQNAGKLEESIEIYSEALRIRPDFTEAYFARGSSGMILCRYKEALEDFQQAIILNPNFAEAYVNMGLVNQDQGLLDQALFFYQIALSINPRQIDALLNMSGVHIRQGHYDKALDLLQQLLNLAPELVEAYANLGVLYYEQGQFAEALKYFDHALTLDPNHVNAHWNRSHVWLKQGNFIKGWPDHEWRWLLQFAKPVNIDKPDWNGSPQPDATIMVYAEGGYGDTFQFYRFLPWLKKQCRRVIFYCQPGTTSLFKQCSVCDEVIEQGNPLPDFDYKVPIMSLAYLAQTTLETIPQDVPYIQADPKLVQDWQTFFSAYSGPKIGLVWSGSVTNPNGYSRSFDVAQLEPLKQFQNFHFFSLQKGPNALTDHSTIIDLNERLTDFHQTAAAIQNLDLVISVDTSVAHLAGALKRPVYLLLHYVSEWRWLQNRPDSPWYPTLRIFRQHTHSDWTSVIADVCQALASDQGVSQGISG